MVQSVRILQVIETVSARESGFLVFDFQYWDLEGRFLGSRSTTLEPPPEPPPPAPPAGEAQKKE